MANITALCVRCRPGFVNREEEFISGLVSFGWSSVHVENCESAEELYKKYSSVYDDFTLHTATQLITFKNAALGSVILSPSIKNPEEVHFLRVLSAYEYIGSRYIKGEIDAAHTLHVQFVHTFTRTDLPENLQKALYASRRAVSNFSKYIDSINDCINNKDHQLANFGGSMADRALKIVQKALSSSNEQAKVQAAIFVLENTHLFNKT